MSKAAYVQLFHEDTALAIKFTKTAQKLAPDVIHGNKVYSQREVALCFNIYNNLSTFYRMNNEEYNAVVYLKKAKEVCEKYKIPIFEFPALVNNQCRLADAERKLLRDKY